MKKLIEIQNNNDHLIELIVTVTGEKKECFTVHEILQTGMPEDGVVIVFKYDGSNFIEPSFLRLVVWNYGSIQLTDRHEEEEYHIPGSIFKIVRKFNELGYDADYDL